MYKLNGTRSNGPYDLLMYVTETCLKLNPDSFNWLKEFECKVFIAAKCNKNFKSEFERHARWHKVLLYFFVLTAI